MKTAKRKASDWMSKYIRLRDALEYCRRMRIDISSFNDWRDLPCACCTCGEIVTVRKADSGHFISRGSGGSSGVYYDERNCNLQCRSCNRFGEGKTLDYYEFMLKKYGEEVIGELRVKDKLTQQYRGLQIAAIEQYYKDRFGGLLKSNF